MTAPNLDYASTPKPAILPKRATCAYPRCQAGGVILPGAPRIHNRSSTATTESYRRPTTSAYHPGCWAAYQRQALDMSMEVTAR